MPQRRRRAVRRLLLVVLVGAVALAACDPPDSNYSCGTECNGYKVYVSPAYHTSTAGQRGECTPSGESGPATERYLARDRAIATAGGGAQGTLVDRGYRARVGFSNYTTNTNSSNSWGAHVHLPMHSNAADACPDSIPASSHGTWQIYQDGSSAGALLSIHMIFTLGPSSPGPNEKVCVPAACTNEPSLVELSGTNAVATYSETEFHTWQAGVNWLATPGLWAWRFGWAIDRYLDYP